MKDFKWIVLIILLAVSFSQDVHLHFGEHDTVNQTLEIWMDPQVAVRGVQFTVTGFHLTGAALGPEVTGFFILSYNDEGLILMFGMEDALPQFDHLFCTISYDEILQPVSCITDVLLADGIGGGYEDFDVEDCLNTGLCELPGDLNLDTILDISDVVIIVNCIMKYESCPCANINGDNIVDIHDIVTLISIILGD